MNQKLNSVYTLFCAIFVGSLFINSSGGRNDDLSGAPSDSGTCANCHSGGSGEGSVSLNNTPTSIQAGQTYALTLSVSHSSAQRAGFQIVATNGTTNAMVGTFTASSGTRVNSNSRLTHNTPKNFSAGSASWTFNWKAPTSNLPSNIKFYYVGNATDGDGGTGGDLVLSGTKTVAATVPVQLISFEAKNNAANRVTLTWATASEKDNSSFIIERSDAFQKFEPIGQLKGHGTSNALNQYQFVDNQIDINSNIVYYRLRQVDINGEIAYSKILSITLENKNSFKIYPTIAHKGEILNIETTAENTKIDIIDINGKMLKTVNSTTQFATILTHDLPSGRYFVRVSGTILSQTAGFLVF